jgi:hypothetical protein
MNEPQTARGMVIQVAICISLTLVSRMTVIFQKTSKIL